MKTNSLGLNIIKTFEGLYKVNPQNNLIYPYICPGGVKTIGYGHTGTFKLNKNAFENGITKEVAELLLEEDVEKIEKSLSVLISARLTENQLSAIVSFCFNLGVGAFASSTLRKKINENPINFSVIEKEFNKWVFSAGRKLNGLARRRKAEVSLYCLNYNIANVAEDEVVMKDENDMLPAAEKEKAEPKPKKSPASYFSSHFWYT